MPSPKHHVSRCCAHCSEPIANGGLVSGDRSEHAFCCAGCQSVYELLQAHNMCEYYAITEHAGNTVSENHECYSEYEALHDADVLGRFTEWTNGSVIRLRFLIPTIHCASCVWLLDRLHRFDDGIRASAVDFVAKTITVDYNKSETSAAAVASVLHRLGYPPLIQVEHSVNAESTLKAGAVRSLYMRLGVAGFAFVNVMMFSLAAYLAGGTSHLLPELHLLFSVASVVLSVLVLAYSAQPWLSSAYRGLRTVFTRGGGLRAWTLDIPVALGMMAIFIRSILDIVFGRGDGYLDSFTGLVFFLLVGRLVLQKTYAGISFNRTYRSFFPLSTRKEEKGEHVIVPIEKIKVADILCLRNAEVVPTDCLLLDSVAYVDYAFVTGESRPIECLQGQMIYTGGRIIGKAIRVSACKDVDHAYLSSLWERSGNHTARSVFDTISNKFALYFTLGTMTIAVGSLLAWLPDYSSALDVFTAVLIIACPCALTIAAPIAFGSAMGLLGTKGIRLKSTQTLSELLDIHTIVFDKTGTLTSAHGVIDMSGVSATADEWEYVRALAAHSTHPVSRLIVADAPVNPTLQAEVVEEFPGLGIRGIVNGIPVLIGRAHFVGLPASTSGTHIMIDGVYAGTVVQKPILRKTGTAIFRRATPVLLSGDTAQDAPLFASTFGTNMWFEQQPTDKVEKINEFQQSGKRVLMIGDGLNDAAALAVADVSIAVTDGASTIAPASDVVMDARNIVNLASVLDYASAIRRVIWVSFVFSMLYNVVGLALAMSGRLTPVLTAILMPLSSLIVIGISVAGAHYYIRRQPWV